MNDKRWNVVITILIVIVVAMNAITMITLLVPDEEAIPRAYQCEVYTEQGCAKYVVASGGELEILSGGTLDIQSGATTDLSGGIDLDGALLDLDADGDTSIQADTDDQIDIEISTADDFQFTANLFEVLSGSAIKMNAGVLDLDADDDTSLTASTDDQIDVEIAGADDFKFTADTFTVLAGSIITLPATADINAYGYVAVGDGTPDGSVADGTDEELYVEGDFEVDGEAEFDGAIDADSTANIAGALTLQALFYPGSADETITDGETLTPTVTVYNLNSGSAVTMTLAACSTDGQLLILVGDDANDITINDTNVRTNDGGVQVINQWDLIAWLCIDAEWIEIADVANS